MKKMKKLLAGFMAVTMVMSMSVTAFADEQNLDNYLDVKPVVPKTYEINNGTAPAETFTFSFDGVSYKNGDGDIVADANIPAIDDVTISFDAISETENKTAEISINADDYQLGVYTYKVTEASGDTAGVTYSEEELYLVLTIIRDEESNQHYVAAMHYESATGEDKSSGFTNEYDAGSLSVTKQIEGNMADMDKEFAFTIVFTAPTDETVDSVITVTKPDMTTETISFADDENTYTYTINLGDDDTVTFANVPEGVTYEVTEDNENYDSDGGVFSDEEKTIGAGDEDSVEFTNTLTNVVDTGISLDNMPYIMVLAMVVLGLVGFVSKKRSMEF